ncbi:MAG: hypothetical protein ACRD96_08825 [Bryobacteraceae bacterium]
MKTAVSIEPLRGHTDREVVAALRAGGATQIEILAPGFISAEATTKCLEALRAIAQIHSKPVKHLRRKASIIRYECKPIRTDGTG